MEMNGALDKFFSTWYTEDPAYWPVPHEYVNRADKLLILFKKWNITSMFDAGCSHRHWMQHNQFAENGIVYSGGDISKSAVDYCNQLWPKLTITHHDLTSDPFPQVDLIFSSDVLIHLNNADKLNFFRNFLNSNSKYLMITHSGRIDLNLDVVYNKNVFPFQPVNWHIDPWNFLKELDWISDSEQSLEYQFRDGRLCLWSRDQIDKIIK